MNEVVTVLPHQLIVAVQSGVFHGIGIPKRDHHRIYEDKVQLFFSDQHDLYVFM